MAQKFGKQQSTFKKNKKKTKQHIEQHIFVTKGMSLVNKSQTST